MVYWDNRIRGAVSVLGGSGQVVHHARITFLNGTKIARSGSLEQKWALTIWEHDYTDILLQCNSHVYSSDLRFYLSQITAAWTIHLADELIYVSGDQNWYNRKNILFVLWRICACTGWKEMIVLVIAWFFSLGLMEIVIKDLSQNSLCPWGKGLTFCIASSYSTHRGGS